MKHSLLFTLRRKNENRDPYLCSFCLRGVQNVLWTFSINCGNFIVIHIGTRPLLTGEGTHYLITDSVQPGNTDKPMALINKIKRQHANDRKRERERGRGIGRRGKGSRRESGQTWVIMEQINIGKFYD